MYIPPIFQATQPQAVRAYLQQHPFATLLSVQAGRVVGTHVPLVLAGDEPYSLITHISRANPQQASLQAGQEVLAIFQGPQGYISNGWYNHLNVPTWNYVAVHVYGTVSILSGKALKKALAGMMERFEAGRPHAQSLAAMPEAFVEKEMKGIIGIEITPTEVQAAFKLSQNRDDVNYQAVVAGLETDANASLAEAMRQQRPALFDEPNASPAH